MKVATASAFDSIQRYSIPLLLLSLSISHLVSPTSVFSIQGFRKADFGSDFALLGDAKRNSSCVNLTTGSGTSSGNIVYKKHFKVIDEESHQPVSFSTDFVFSLSTHHGGDGLALVMGAADHPAEFFGKGPFGIANDSDKKFVAVEYDTRKDKDGNGGDEVGVGVGSSVDRDAVDLSSIGLVLNGGERLRSWVDYEAGSKRLEIRLSKYGSEKPYDPLVSSAIDLVSMWGDKGVLMGISSSSSKNSQQMTSLWSWSFRIGAIAIAPPATSSILSDPPDDDQHEAGGTSGKKKKKKNCFLKILGGVIFVTGCGTLVVFFLLLFWVILFGSRYEVPPEIPLKSGDFRYEMVDGNVDRVSEGSARTSIHN